MIDSILDLHFTMSQIEVQDTLNVVTKLNEDSHNLHNLFGMFASTRPTLFR